MCGLMGERRSGSPQGSSLISALRDMLHMKIKHVTKLDEV